MSPNPRPTPSLPTNSNKRRRRNKPASAALFVLLLTASAACAEQGPLAAIPPSSPTVAAPESPPAAAMPAASVPSASAPAVSDSIYPKPAYSPTALRDAAALEAIERGESAPTDPASVPAASGQQAEDSIYPKPVYAPTALPGAVAKEPAGAPMNAEPPSSPGAAPGEPIRIKDVASSATADTAGVPGPDLLTKNFPFGNHVQPETVLSLIRAMQRQEPDSSLRRAEQVYLQYALPYPVRGMGSEGDLLAARVRALVRSGAEKQALALLNRAPEGLRKPAHLRQRVALIAVTGGMAELCSLNGEQLAAAQGVADEVNLFCAAQKSPAAPEELARLGEVLSEQDQPKAAHWAALLAEGKNEQAKTEWLADLRDRYLTPDDMSPSATPSVQSVPENLKKLVAALETHAGTAEEVYQKLASYRAANDDALSADDNLAFLSYFVTRGLKLPDTLYAALIRPSAELGAENALAMAVMFYQFRKQRPENQPPGNITLTAKALRKSGFKAEADALAARFAQ